MDPLKGDWVPLTVVREDGSLERIKPNVVVPFENSLFKGCLVGCLRPSHDPQLESSDYPYKFCFEGRKRLWEIRLQGEFKRELPNQFLTGVEMSEYVPVNFTVRWTVRMLMPLMRKTMSLGTGEFNVSHGDDPESSKGEREWPQATGHLTVWDRIIESDIGKEPRIDTDLVGQGYERTVLGVAKYKQTISKLRFRPGKIFTFSMWGPSQYFDIIQGKVVKLFIRAIPFHQLCGTQPYRMHSYELAPDVVLGEDPVPPSKKTYIFQLLIGGDLRYHGRGKVDPPDERCDEEFVDAMELEDEAMVSSRQKCEILRNYVDLENSGGFVLENDPHLFWRTFKELPLKAVCDGVEGTPHVLEYLEALRKEVIRHSYAFTAAAVCINHDEYNSTSKRKAASRVAERFIPKDSPAYEMDALDASRLLQQSSLPFLRIRNMLEASWPENDVRNHVLKKRDTLIVCQRLVPGQFTDRTEVDLEEKEERELCCCLQ